MKSIEELNKSTKCPKCGQAISTLNVVVTERNLYHWQRTSAGPEFDTVENLEFDIDYWECPECFEELPINPDEESAYQFLEGETQ